MKNVFARYPIAVSHTHLINQLGDSRWSEIAILWLLFLAMSYVQSEYGVDRSNG
ncbi:MULTISPECIES: hypothetical protein [unclassified Vibrio]|uniref:Uncharacterized protein n=1 Tax=Vibrio sp. HB236076 TaxID=3232307 RepID=A0AB39HL20_9VIBR|nr:hypothetical protein [Vibrio sp. HB161653]MDP5253252.1 hypothetical protein [Vibrio sp. HB161653]